MQTRSATQQAPIPLPPHHSGPRRLGPRPLPLHLMTALYASLSLPTAWRSLNDASGNWNPPASANLQKLQKLLADAERETGDTAALDSALRAEGLRHAHHFLTGVAHYQTSTVKRDLPDAPVVWQAGNTKLRDYAPGNKTARPVLVIPSLINRYHILDLDHGQSFLRFLAAQGLRPMLVDWDSPDEAEIRFTLDAYMAHRLLPALTHVIEVSGQTPHVMGYCMGGLLALALAQLGGDAVQSLSLLATPWDFNQTGLTDILRNGSLTSIINDAGYMPVDMIQSLFALQQPLQVFKKFRDFGARIAKPVDGYDNRRFVLVEDWLNDGVPLAAPVATQCLTDWYGRNTTKRGTWSVGGHVINPTAVKIPICVIIPQQDRVVAPAAALPLAHAIPAAHLLQPDTGHIGMMASKRAESILWRPFLSWIASLA